ncbi:MAG: acetyl-CoA carboxylase biotin carboxylase subunit [Herpetosiphon sp.]
MFDSVLIANRGEIAIRVMQACKELGLRTVAVYSEADRDSLHVQYADEAFLVGPPPATESYLQIGTLIEVARQARAGAVHPGYGFLAENAAFAQACADAGIVFIGPPVEAMERMGDKVAARNEATAAQVPLVMGTLEAVTRPEKVAELAAEYGYPIAIKAAAGGGGRGLKVVQEEGQVVAAFEAAQREAAAYFNDDTVYVEKYIGNPRHIEIQVLADQHGTVLALGERDCSIQRRHQKLIEETPSPALDDVTRHEMQAAAVRLCHQVDYVGAGTLEFLWEAGRFYFLEMNTRIQVEHTVTEAVSGLDLVKWQIRIAQGERLPYEQHQIQMRGHAIECRINAEDPGNHFAPSLGTLVEYREPRGPGVRVDGGFTTGSTIPQFYDSMIAKLVTWGEDRAEAIARMERALSDFVIGGVKTTIPFHALVMKNAAFRAGEATVRFIETEIGELALRGLQTPAPPAADEDALAETEAFLVEVNGKRFTVRVAQGTDGRRQSRSSGRQAAQGNKAGRREADPNTVVAPLQGTLAAVRVKAGDTVEAGQVVAIIEAMKMENEIVAPRAGTINAVLVTAGATVQANSPILTLATA